MYYESNFSSEEWTRGAYAASYDLGGLHRWGSYQHVDGAVRMGDKVARQILEARGASAR